MLRNRIAVKIAFFVNGFVYAGWISRLPRIQEIYHIDNGTTGILLLASSIGAVGAMPFTGWVIIKNGSRRITLFSAIMYCVILPFIPVMPGFVSLIILFLAMGIVTGMLDVAMNAQAVMVERQYNRPIMTSFHALFSIGMTIGAWSGSLFVYLSLELLLHFSSIVVVSLLSVLWASKNLIHDKTHSSVKTSHPLFRLPTSQLLSVGLIAFCCMLGEGAIGDWSVNYMENISHASKDLAPVGLSAFALAMTVGRIFGDRVRAAIGDKKLITLGALIATTGMSLTLLFPSPYAAIIGFFLTGIGLSTIVPIAYSLAGSAKGLSSEVALAMVTTVGYSGFLLGPPVIGFIADRQTLRIALGVVAILFVIMTILGFRHKTKA